MDIEVNPIKDDSGANPLGTTEDPSASQGRLAGRGLLRTLATQSALYAAAGALNKVLALVTVPILTRTLSPSGYGLSELATALAALLTMLSLFGADIPAARAAALSAPGPARGGLYFSYVATVGTIGLLAGGATWLLSGSIASHLWSTPGATDLAVLTATLVPVAAIRGALITVQRIEGNATRFAVLSAVDLVAKLSLAVTFVLLGEGPIGVVRGFLVGNLIGLAATAAVTRPLLSGRLKVATAAHLLVRGAAFLPAGIAFLLADYAIRFVVVDRISVAAVGQLAVAVRVASVMGLATAGFSLAWGPYAIARAPGRATTALFGRVFLAFGTISALIALAIGFIGSEVVTLLSGTEFAPAAEALPGLLLAAGMSGAVFILMVAAGVGGRTGWVAVAALAGAAVQIALALMLTSALGIAGVGVAAVAGQVAALGIAWRAAGLTIGLRWSPFAVSIAAATALMLVAELLNADADASRLVRFSLFGLSTIAALISLRQLVALPTWPRYAGDGLSETHGGSAEDTGLP